MRATIARALVVWVSKWWQVSHDAHAIYGTGTAWDRLARRIDAALIPVATRLDRDAAGRQMTEESWWG